MTRIANAIERMQRLRENRRGRAIAALSHRVFVTAPRVRGPWNNSRWAKKTAYRPRFATGYDLDQANPGNADLRPGGTFARACKIDQSGLVRQQANYLILSYFV